MYSHELTLISYSISEDGVGNNIKEPIKETILCKVGSITQNEFYHASTTDLKPNKKFTVHKFEYNGQNHVEFQNQMYSVIRTFELDNQLESRYDKYAGLGFDEIELTCERVVGQ